MKKHKKIFLSIIVLILIGSVTFIFYRNNNQNDFKQFMIVDKTDNTEEKLDVYKEEITSLQEQYNNTDIVGTLEIDKTDYKVPIVQGIDNKFYLKHLPNKDYSIMGSIFLDYRVNINASRKLLIYGHNSATIDMPFKILENYYDIDYIKSHPYVTIKTKEKVRKYEIFSLYVAISDYKYMNVNFTDNEYKEHINYLKNNSMYNIESNLNDNDNILILQTCSTHKDYLKYKKKYLVIAFHEVNLEDNK